MWIPVELACLRWLEKARLHFHSVCSWVMLNRLVEMVELSSLVKKVQLSSLVKKVELSSLVEMVVLSRLGLELRMTMVH